MEQCPGDKQAVKNFPLVVQKKQIIGNREVVCNLAQGDQSQDAGRHVDQDNPRHDNPQVKGTRCMGAIKERSCHHQNGVQPYPVVGGNALPDMYDPGQNHSCRDQDQSPFSPGKEQGFTDQNDREQGIAE